VGNAIPFEDKKAIEDVACYLVRAPLSLKKLVYLDGQKAVLYRSKMNPFLGRNFEAMDPREWLARLAEHIPDAGKHRTHFYAYYPNRARGQRSPEDGAGPKDETEAPKKRRCTPSWARLISKVYQADPLVCRKCGGPLKIVAYVTDDLAFHSSSAIAVHRHGTIAFINGCAHAAQAEGVPRSRSVAYETRKAISGDVNVSDQPEIGSACAPRIQPFRHRHCLCKAHDRIR
jgi:hypothetical protein